MSVSLEQFRAAVVEHQGVAWHERGKNWHLKHKFQHADLERLGPGATYKIKEIRHIVAQLQLDKAIIKKHIPEL